MRPILRVNNNVIELNALFIQPTRWCGLDCEGCYVKEHMEESFHTPWLEQFLLFRKFFKELDNCWANQITISIDDLPKNSSHRSAHMISLFNTIIQEVYSDRRNKDERPEVHMTFHTHHTINQYANDYQAINIEMLKTLDMISISEISKSKGDFYQSLMGGNALLNWNYLIPEVKSNFNWEKEISKFEFANKYFDHIYLVIMKTPVGRPRNDLIKIGDQARMKNDQFYIDSLFQRVSPEIKRKIDVDGCLNDVKKYITTGFGCSSNISKFQVWPDGSVTGCPYAFQTNGTTKGQNAEDILENIRREREKYDFKDRCHLPEIYRSIG